MGGCGVGGGGGDGVAVLRVICLHKNVGGEGK